MYPIYPLICASAALTIKPIEQLVVGTKRPYSSPVFKVIIFTCCLAYLGLSFSRVISLHQGFRATFDVFSDLKKFDKDGYQPVVNISSNNANNSSVQKHINVCYGKEWYRYPSSFFLPGEDKYRLRFIRSDFKGQLPKLYENDDPKFKGLKTRIVYDDFNDLNKEEISRYVKPEQCHYLIDSSQSNVSENEPDYSKNADVWKILSTHKMLDLHNSPIIIRSFYLPFISEKRNSYTDYQLLRNNKLFVGIY